MKTLIIAFIKARLKEPSTWRGLIAIATGYGIYISPANQNAIITIGMILMGGTGVLTADPGSPTPAEKIAADNAAPDKVEPAS